MSIDVERIQEKLLNWEKRIIASEEAIRAERLMMEREKAALATVLSFNARISATDTETQSFVASDSDPNRPLVTVKEATEEAVIAIAKPHKVFTSDQIAAYIEEKYPKSFLSFDIGKSKPNISRYLNEMCTRKALQIVQTASGSRPAKYTQSSPPSS